MALHKSILLCFIGLLSLSALSSSASVERETRPAYDSFCYKSKFGTPKPESCKKVCDSIPEISKDGVNLTSDGKEVSWSGDGCVVTAKHTGCVKEDIFVERYSFWAKCFIMQGCLGRDKAALYQADINKGEPGEFAMSMAGEQEFPPELHTCYK